MEKKEIPSINTDYFEDLTGTLPEPENPSNGDVGVRIRHLRTEKGLSLEKLSQMTGFEVSVLEGIENNTIHPQLGTIMRLSKALDGAITRLISGQGNKPYEITRRGDRKTVARSTSGKGGRKVYTYYSLAHDVHGRHMEPLIVELEEVPDVQAAKHEGEEFVFVLSGTARLVIDNETYDLEPGDSAYYLSTAPHFITGKGGKATILAVLYED